MVTKSTKSVTKIQTRPEKGKTRVSGQTPAAGLVGVTIVKIVFAPSSCNFCHLFQKRKHVALPHFVGEI